MDSSEATLVERLLARDEDGLRDAIDAHGAAVYGMARRILNDPVLAEEVAQDTFVALWRRPGAFDPERGALRVFLLGIARNKAIDLVRREEALKRAKESLVAEAQIAQGNAVIELDAADRQQEVGSALAQLSDVQKEAIVLAYFGGRTYREVAAELGIPEGTAKTRMRDALLKLRELMGSYEES
jgi:RNA polymerase sigma-70 factor (ECF subfamily)